ncbi:MAG: GvpL/GvpF family gas vesicle protein [Desulfobacter sp.]
MTEPENHSPPKDLLYLYGFAVSTDLEDIQGTGIDGQSPLFLNRAGNMAAILSHASLADFTGDTGEENLGDINWITPRACRHQEVIARVMARSPVLPVRFGTLFLTQASLDRTIHTHGAEITAFLGHVRGREEWAIKGYMDRKKALKQVARDLAAQTAEAPRDRSPDTRAPGTRYFQKKKQEQEAEQMLKQAIHTSVMAIADILEPLGVDMTERDLMSRAATGKETDMVLNWAALLEKDEVSRFRNRVDEINTAHQQEGLTLEFSGPWPPYSFCPAIGAADDERAAP